MTPSPDKPNTDGYTRICKDCGGDMPWEWGGKQTYFQCEKCKRIEPCASVIIERSKNTVTIEEGNKRKTFEFRPDDFGKVLETALGSKMGVERKETFQSPIKASTPEPDTPTRMLEDSPYDRAFIDRISSTVTFEVGTKKEVITYPKGALWLVIAEGLKDEEPFCPPFPSPFPDNLPRVGMVFDFSPYNTGVTETWRIIAEGTYKIEGNAFVPINNPRRNKWWCKKENSDDPPVLMCFDTGQVKFRDA